MELDELLQPLLTSKEMCFLRVQRLYERSKAVTTDPSMKDEFLARVQDLGGLRAEYDRCVAEINSLNRIHKPKFVPSYNEIEAFDELYYAIRTIANNLTLLSSDLCAKFETGNDVNKNVTDARCKLRVKLPELHLAKFDGKLENWTTYRDTFRSLIHDNSSISSIEKYYYLLSAVSGPALSIVKSMPINADNYAIVWNALVKRYENKRALATAYLDKLFSFKSVHNESALNLNNFLITYQENIKALELLDIPDLSGFLLFYVSLRNLDAVTRREFEQTVSSDKIPTITDLLAFVERQARVLEMSEYTRSVTVKSATQPKQGSSKSTPPTTSRYSDTGKSYYTQKPTCVASTDKSESKHFHACSYCQKPHSIYRCTDYNDLTPELRTAKVKELKLCENCLRNNHTVKDCTSKHSCTVCKKRHHVTLHTDSTKSKENVVALTSLTEQTVLLGTAVMHVSDAWGQYHTVRALIDSGAMSSYITHDCAKRLGLSRRKCDFEPVGLGGNRVRHFGLTTCTLKPRDDSAPLLKTDAVIVAEITGELPTVCLPNKIFYKYQNLDLADPTFYKPAPVDLLIAGDLFPYIYSGKKILPDQKGMPVAMKSIFGYVITGQVALTNRVQESATIATAAVGNNSDSTFCGFTGAASIDQIMDAFWNVENVPSEKPRKPDDILAEKLFAKEHRRDETGKFIVKYPLRPDHSLGESRQMAVRRLINLEKKLDHDPPLKTEYHKFMAEYESLGHMTCLGEIYNVDSKYLIPHFCIIKPSSTTTKLRTVFDASCKTTNHLSFNDIVLPGPKLQADINQILINFRLHEVCLSADICKMYRQILIDKEQRPFQHILWRNSTDQLIRVYELNTVTYGVASSPYLAIKVLHTLAELEAEKYPAAAKVLKTGFFMDDLLWSEPKVEDALRLLADLRALLEGAGFILRKWSSNCPKILAAVPEDHRETPIEFDDEQNLSLKVLGLQWQPVTDCFTFQTAPSETDVTKRTILSQIGRLFDPLGFVAPCVFYAKCFMQKLWAQNLDWDQRLPVHLESEWLEYIRELPLLSKFSHTRHVMVERSTCCRILGFCDASTLGYAAVVYLHTTNRDGEQKVSLLIAKSKVAPLKTLSVPRLELMAAHLLAKVVKYVTSILAERGETIDETLLFTDSSVVLAWLNTPSYKLKVFVATRVTKILETVPSHIWFHVSGDQNPADICSRGALPSVLLTTPEWLNGPNWLLTKKWPVRSMNEFREENLPELKPANESKSMVSTDNSSNSVYNLTERYSNFSKMVNVVARLHQFIRNCRAPKHERTRLSISDLRKAHDTLLKVVQQHHFAEDIVALSKGLKPHQSLRKLNPFMGSDCFLRVGGRLSQSDMTYDKKHPALLPKKSNFTNCLIDYYHVLYLHVGPRTLQGILSQKYWIVSARSVIRSRTMKCIACFKVRPTNRQPIMGQLPKFRTQDIHTFHTVGVDIGGPFYTKESTRKNARISKSYLCIYVCCATRAVHLETLTSLNTESFLASFDRFTARRGLCHAIISDNGTNFVAAGKQLAEVVQFLESNLEEISSSFTTRKVEWKHNPPAGSHFGGIYEAAIKSAKSHLKRTIGNRALTFEELSTLFTRIEAVLNSRPLSALSSDPSEFEVLTPAHFLIGRDLLEAPEYDITGLPVNKLNRWQAVQQISQQFWHQWRKDYLHTLQQRQKWFDNCPDLAVGDLVLIHSDAPPLQWALGRVTKLHPGPDGVVRVVTLRTKSSEFTRPVVKLSPLPLEQE